MTDVLLALALTGSRASGFNHDCASKLQALIIALDEISEISATNGDPDFVRAAETATDSVRELIALLDGNRALTKPPVRTATTVRALFDKAAERASVRISGALPEQAIQVALPAVTHALALLLDLAAELAPPGRTATIEDGVVKSARQPTAAILAVATFAFARDGGTLAVTPTGFAISFA